MDRCERCGAQHDLTSTVAVRNGLGELLGEVPMIIVEVAPDRQWIICDGCNTLLCSNHCVQPESGLCDQCFNQRGSRAVRR